MGIGKVAVVAMVVLLLMEAAPMGNSRISPEVVAMLNNRRSLEVRGKGPTPTPSPPQPGLSFRTNSPPYVLLRPVLPPPPPPPPSV